MRTKAIDAENAGRMEDNKMKDMYGNYLYDEGNIMLQMEEERVPLIEYEYMVELLVLPLLESDGVTS